MRLLRYFSQEYISLDNIIRVFVIAERPFIKWYVAL